MSSIIDKETMDEYNKIYNFLLWIKYIIKFFKK